MKKLLMLLGGLGVVATFAVMLPFGLTAGVADTADDFFAALNRGGAPAAKGLLSRAFVAGTSDEETTRFLSGDLSRVVATSWSTRSIENGSGRLIGELTTREGGVLPVELALVKEDAGWRIQNIQLKSPAGIGGSRPVVPDVATQQALVVRTMDDFAKSVAAQDMSHFRSQSAKLWQSQFSVEHFRNAYEPLLQAQFDWSFVERTAPVIDAEPDIDGDGVLKLSGHYRTDPHRVNFEQKFIQEEGQWALLGFNLRIE